MWALAHDAQGIALVTLGWVNSAAPGAPGGRLGSGTHVWPVSALPAKRARFGLASKRFAPVRGGSIANPERDLGAIEENLGHIRCIKALSF